MSDCERLIFWAYIRLLSTPVISATPAQLAGIEAEARARRELRQKLAAPVCDPAWSRSERELWAISARRKAAKKVAA